MDKKKEKNNMQALLVQQNSKKERLLNMKDMKGKNDIDE